MFCFKTVISHVWLLTRFLVGFVLAFLTYVRWIDLPKSLFSMFCIFLDHDCLYRT